MIMKRNSSSFKNYGPYTSPGTPDRGDNNVGEFQLTKGWHSERVPLSTSSSTFSSRKNISAIALMPYNGKKALPSKWDDAERWITSPVSGFTKVYPPPHRRPTSKSGPLPPQGLGYYSNHSPQVLENREVRSFMGNYGLSTGVVVPDGLSIHYGMNVKANSLYEDENNILRSTSVPGMLDSFRSISSSQDDKQVGAKMEEAMVTSRMDMATRMSPNGSTRSSSNGRLSFSTFSLPTSMSNSAAKDETRDVQVDKGTTTTTTPKSKKRELNKMKNSTNVEDKHSYWSVTEASKNTSRLQREEAKITTWENLQKAKAEAALRKLEMTLEKKRSSSMDKIMNKLNAAQTKADAMRNSLFENHAHPASRTSRRMVPCCLSLKIRSMGNCFICHRH